MQSISDSNHKSSRCYSAVYRFNQVEVGQQERQTSEASMTLLQQGNLLVHYDAGKPRLLQTEASQYGPGVVITHRMPDGSEWPITFASRTMSQTEKKYSQYEKEALSIIFGSTKFHKYLHSRSF